MVLILLGLCLLGGVITGAQIYYRLSYFWIFFYFGNYLWARFSVWNIEISRNTRTYRAQLGQVFEEKFEVYNRTRLGRLWLEVRDDSIIPGSRSSQVFTMIGGNEIRTYIARTRLIQRGVYLLGPTVLSSGDLFGMFPQEVSYPSQESLLVYPMLVDIRGVPNPLGFISGGDALRRRTPQITPNASGVRDYAPGDSLNRIHWKTTARKNQLMVKEFELDPLADVWIFLDAERRVQSGLRWTPPQQTRMIWRSENEIELPPTTEEYGASIAGSLARFFLRNKRSVGLVSHCENPILLPADRGGRQLIKILEALALWKADGTLPLMGVIEAQAKHLPRGSTICLITPSVEDAVALAGSYLARRGMRPIVVLLSADSFGGRVGSAALVERVKAVNLPVRRISNGDNLGVALSDWIAG